MPAQIILSQRDELLDIDPEDPDMLHFALSKLPKALNVERLIAQSVELFRQFPPQSLPGGIWRRVSSFSVLKTTHGMVDVDDQTLHDGERYFERQASQLKFQQNMVAARRALWRARRPAGVVGVAVMVAVFSWWFQRNISLGTILGLWQRARSMIFSN